jgi:hypothetical protein
MESAARLPILAVTDASSAHAVAVDRRDWAAVDLTGRFPIKSRRGHECAPLTALRGYIHVEPMKSKTASACVLAFKNTFAFFHKCHQTIAHLATDNESSTLLVAFFESLPSPPEVH